MAIWSAPSVLPATCSPLFIILGACYSSTLRWGRVSVLPGHRSSFQVPNLLASAEWGILILMNRCRLWTLAALLVACAARADERVLRVVPHSNLVILDPRRCNSAIKDTGVPPGSSRGERRRIRRRKAAGASAARPSLQSCRTQQTLGRIALDEGGLPGTCSAQRSAGGFPVDSWRVR